MNRRTFLKVLAASIPTSLLALLGLKKKPEKKVWKVTDKIIGVDVSKGGDHSYMVIAHHGGADGLVIDEIRKYPPRGKINKLFPTAKGEWTPQTNLSKILANWKHVDIKNNTITESRKV